MKLYSLLIILFFLSFALSQECKAIGEDVDISSIMGLNVSAPGGHQKPSGTACECSFAYSYCPDGMTCQGNNGLNSRNVKWYFNNDFPFLSWKKAYANNAYDRFSFKLIVNLFDEKILNRCNLAIQYTDHGAAKSPIIDNNEVLQLIRANVDPNVLTIGSASCVAIYEKQKVCCCKLVENGSLTQTRECVETDGSMDDPKVCSKFGNLDEVGTFFPYKMPASGGCADLQSDQLNTYTSEKEQYSISVEKLQQEAAAKLNPLNFTGPENFLGRLMKGMMTNIGAIALALYVWAGFLWMTASGNAENVTKAKSILIWTSLGLVVILSSYLLVSFVLSTLGV